MFVGTFEMGGRVILAITGLHSLIFQMPIGSSLIQHLKYQVMKVTVIVNTYWIPMTVIPMTVYKVLTEKSFVLAMANPCVYIISLLLPSTWRGVVFVHV